MVRGQFTETDVMGTASVGMRGGTDIASSPSAMSIEGRGSGHIGGWDIGDILDILSIGIHGEERGGRKISLRLAV